MSSSVPRTFSLICSEDSDDEFGGSRQCSWKTAAWGLQFTNTAVALFGADGDSAAPVICISETAEAIADRYLNEQDNDIIWHGDEIA